MGDHTAKRWVEGHFPAATGNLKAALILAFGMGLDHGLAEAQQILENAELNCPAPSFAPCHACGGPVGTCQTCGKTWANHKVISLGNGSKGRDN